jgi:hypothetical protein
MTAGECNTEAVTLIGHRHGPDCGHEMVKHDDHYDFVSDDGELHHRVEEPVCCEVHERSREPLFVSHGLFSTLIKCVHFNIFTSIVYVTYILARCCSVRLW